MTKKQTLYFSLDVVVYPILLVFASWLVFWAETRFKINLNFLGIMPQKLEGLRGIFFAPFIHGSLKHLFNNSIPLLVLGTALFYFYRNVRWKVLLLGMLLTGILTWVIGRPASHIGASGVVYLLASFLFFKGIFSKHYQLTALALVVVFLYGSLLWYIFPIDPKISWEGHLSGLLVGLLFAVIFKKNPVDKPKFEWENESYNEADDPFMRHFDEHGNFIESIEEDNNNDEGTEENPLEKSVRIVYSFKKADEKESAKD